MVPGIRDIRRKIDSSLQGNRWYQGARQRIGRSELIWLILLAAIAGGIWAFAEVTDEVMEGEARPLDRAILLALRAPGNPADPIGPGWVEEIGRDVTALGGIAVLTLFSLAAVGTLLLHRKRRIAVVVAVSILGGLGVSNLLKLVFDRPRPDLVSHTAVVYTSSFPSGHAVMAAVTYLTLAALLMRVCERLAVRAYIFFWAVVLTVLVGVSRVYVGVHWPTDVLAGWAVGATWALGWWLLALLLERRNLLDGPAEQPAERSQDR